MFRIILIGVGKLRERHWQEAQAEYLKRLSTSAKIEVIEVESEPLGETVTPAQTMKAEGEKILKRLPDGARIVALDKGGNMLDSGGLATFLRQHGGSGEKLIFIIGGAAGLSADVLGRAQHRLSMSALTFTHEMARIILLEQLYRAGTILAGEKDHY